MSERTTSPAFQIMKQKVEAYGVKGMKSTPWRKTFKSMEAMEAWLDKTGAELHGVCFLEAGEDTFR
jgi:hypothetical protein